MLSNALNHAHVRALMHEREREVRAAQLRVLASRARRARRRRMSSAGHQPLRWLRRLLAPAR
jgi:hypothetical protein